MTLKISTGVKTKKESNKKQTFFINVFTGLTAMQKDIAIFRIKANNFPELIQLLGTSGQRFKELAVNKYSLHNGWSKSQTSNKTKRGLCLSKEQFLQIRLVLDDILTQPKTIAKNKEKCELVDFE